MNPYKPPTTLPETRWKEINKDTNHNITSPTLKLLGNYKQQLWRKASDFFVVLSVSGGGEDLFSM